MHLKNILMISAALCSIDNGADAPSGIVPMPPEGGIESARSTDQRTPGEPFAEVDGKSFATQEELSAYVAQKTGDTSHPNYKAPEAEEEKPAKADEEGLKDPEKKEPPKADDKKADDGKPAWIQPTITDDALKASLAEAGGFAAEPEYFPLAAEFERTGTVSEEALKTYAEAKGVPLDMAKAFVQGQAARRDLAATTATQVSAAAQAAVDATVKSVYEAVGGEDNYKALTTWSQEAGNLTPAELASYNKAIDDNPTAALSMLKDFNSRFTATGGGAAPRDITNGQGNGGNTPPTAPKGYASMAEQLKDQGSAEYAKDPAYRKMVQDRIAATTAY